MNSYKELKNHLLCEFYIIHKNPKTILNESRSVVNGLVEFIDNLCNSVMPQAMGVMKSRPHSATKTYTNKTNPEILQGLPMFFKDFSFTITIEERAPYYKGGSSTDSIFVNSDGNIECVPSVMISVGGMNVEEVMTKLSTGMGHELTHVFNLYKYATSNPKKFEEDPAALFNNVFSDQRYGNIRDTRRNAKTNNEKAIAEVLYRLNRMERNAYIAEVQMELLNKKERITDAKSAYDLIRTTSSWGHFKFLERNMQALYTVTNRESQNVIITATNEIMGKNFTNYNQVLKYFQRRFNKWKKQYIRNVSKIAYDVYLEKNKSMTLDDCGLDGNKLDEILIK